MAICKTLYMVSHVIFIQNSMRAEDDEVLFQSVNSDDRIYALKKSAFSYLNFLSEKIKGDTNVEFIDETEKYINDYMMSAGKEYIHPYPYPKNATIFKILEQRHPDKAGLRHMIKIVSYNLQER